jgi:hypothetical protein
MRCTSLAGHHFASPDDVGTDSEPYKVVRQSMRCSEPNAFEDEQKWLAGLSRKTG